MHRRSVLRRSDTCRAQCILVILQRDNSLKQKLTQRLIGLIGLIGLKAFYLTQRNRWS
eukprot:CAMPEP_0176319608 /NCGR_PEP_ID=MMETSP0121_2-20121125/70390_1 /TAXON_ID=160619 /ORGANISM="Kryptoperidinium foliaceum, Strain CCMP 1326" /LENGTH=57 /DNA_ID=CAMNT_0017661963 /DNA_START=54 /DNA_END=224 /DNA_ORIENTATION=+